jgi:hypothetical protein
VVENLEPSPKLLMLDGGAKFFFVEYGIGTLFTFVVIVYVNGTSLKKAE